MILFGGEVPVPFRRLGTSLIYLVRPVVTGLLCPEDNGTPEIDPVDRCYGCVQVSFCCARIPFREMRARWHVWWLVLQTYYYLSLVFLIWKLDHIWVSHRTVCVPTG